jgi:tRNA C32,U32 (ribose-2'-O)-methylase TrmJ
MAVQIVAYEILRAREVVHASSLRLQPLAPAEDLEKFYAHLEAVLALIEFRDRTVAGTHLMERIRRLFQRAEMDVNELNILRGILTAVEQRRRRAGEHSNTRPVAS